jgi:formate dehydrogenase subunit delta
MVRVAWRAARELVAGPPRVMYILSRYRVAGRWSRIAGRWSLVADRWSRIAGRGSLVAGRGSLVAGRWSLVADRWSRIAGAGPMARGPPAQQLVRPFQNRVPLAFFTFKNQRSRTPAAKNAPRAGRATALARFRTVNTVQNAFSRRFPPKECSTWDISGKQAPFPINPKSG